MRVASRDAPRSSRRAQPGRARAWRSDRRRSCRRTRGPSPRQSLVANAPPLESTRPSSRDPGATSTVRSPASDRACLCPMCARRVPPPATHGVHAWTYPPYTKASLYIVGAVVELSGILLVASPDLVPGALRFAAWARPRLRRIENGVRRLFRTRPRVRRQTATGHVVPASASADRRPGPVGSSGATARSLTATAGTTQRSAWECWRGRHRQLTEPDLLR